MTELAHEANKTIEARLGQTPDGLLLIAFRPPQYRDDIPPVEIEGIPVTPLEVCVQPANNSSTCVYVPGQFSMKAEQRYPGFENYARSLAEKIGNVSLNSSLVPVGSPDMPLFPKIHHGKQV